MRYLRQQVLNRRDPGDQRLYVDMTDSVIMNTTNHLMLPKGTEAERPVNTTWTSGMVRYNTTTHEVEVYQGTGAAAGWRTLRYKEPGLIIQQNLANGDGVNTVFGPLSPQPVLQVSTDITVWNEAQIAKQLIVIVGNVFQVSGTNYIVIKGEDITIGPDALGPYTTGTYYIQFTSSVPGLSTPVVVLHGFDY